MRRVSGKVALVTGAGSGQGAVGARLLAQEGAKVIATDIDYGSVRKVVGEINMQNPGAGLALKHDVSMRDDWFNTIRTGVEAFGPITVLINNTDIPTPTFRYQAPEENSIRTRNIDAWSHFVGMETVVPVMKWAGVGSIVDVAPLEVLVACVHFDTYATRRRTADAFLRTVAAELAPFNIRVNAIAQGLIEKPAKNDVLSLIRSAESISGDRYFCSSGLADDVGQLVLYLASDESSSMTGTLHIIDPVGFNVSERGVG